MALSHSLLIFTGIAIFKFVLLAFISIGFIIWLRKASKDKSKLGINFKRVYCPLCITKQPIMRMPKNERQALYGGGTCSGCQAELDKYGDVIL